MAKLIASINALAELVGRSPPAVQKWVKHSEWPFGNAPWKVAQVDEIKLWAKETLQEDRARTGAKDADGSLAKAKLQKLLREIKELDLKIGERAGSTHDIATCEQQQTERIQYTKLVMTSQTPSAAVQKIRERERALGRALADLEMADIIRTQIEQAITTNLNQGSGVRGQGPG